MSMFPSSQAWQSGSIERDAAQSRLLLKFFNSVYAWMFVGLGVTALVGYAMSRSPAMLKIVYGNRIGYIAFGLGAFLVAQAAQGVAMRIGAAAGTALFLLYAALIGALVSGIFLVYPNSTLAAAFLVTGGTFGAVSVLGFVTKLDLTRVGGILTMAVIGLFLASIVNVFMASDALSWVITYAVLAVFIGLTAYYTQKLKRLALDAGDDAEMLSRLSVVGSLLLYAAFINLFLSILRIMGGNRR